MYSLEIYDIVTDLKIVRYRKKNGVGSNNQYQQDFTRVLPNGLRPIPLIEVFLNDKPVRTAHSEDARRLLVEFDQAVRFEAFCGSERFCHLLDGVSQIRRYNKPV